MLTKILLVACFLSSGAASAPALAQTESPADEMQRSAQDIRDSFERDAQSVRDSASGASGPTRDPGAADAPFDKNGNSNYDAHGAYQGCHSVGCQVDDPDSASPADDVSRDDRSSRLGSDSSSSSMDFGDRRGRGRDSWSVDSVIGDWTIGDKNGSSTCTLKLYSDESFGLRRAWTTAGCPDGFFSVDRWRAAGRDLQLTDMGGAVIGAFRQVGPGRFEGRRVSDGAPMFLSRR